MTRGLLIGIAVLAPVAAIALYPFGVVVALAPIFVSHLLLLYACLAPNCQWWGPVARSFATIEREVWLTIDDGPCPAHTPRILDLLDVHDARATFFVVGTAAERFPHLITEILVRGHSVANHTWSHPSGSFWAAGAARTTREVDRCTAHLRPTHDRPAQYFRAPAGLKNPFLHGVLRDRALQLVGWNIRSLDTVRRDADQIANSVGARLQPGAIILMHEGHRLERDADFNPRCIELTLQKITDAGYRCVIPRPEQLRQSADGK